MSEKIKTKTELKKYMQFQIDELQKKEKRLNALINYFHGKNKKSKKITVIAEFQNNIFSYIKLIDDIDFLQDLINPFFQELNNILDENVKKYEDVIKTDIRDQFSPFKEKIKQIQEELEKSKIMKDEVHQKWDCQTNIFLKRKY